MKKKQCCKDYRGLVVALLISALIILAQKNTAPIQEEKDGVLFFYSPRCTFCDAQAEFNEMLQIKYPNLIFKTYDITKDHNDLLYVDLAERLNMTEYGVPTTIYNDHFVVGFKGADSSGAQIEAMVRG